MAGYAPGNDFTSGFGLAARAEVNDNVHITVMFESAEAFVTSTRSSDGGHRRRDTRPDRPRQELGVPARQMRGGDRRTPHRLIEAANKHGKDAAFLVGTIERAALDRGGAKLIVYSSEAR